MRQSTLEPIELITGGDAAAQPVASVIVLHGLGADGRDFVPIAQELDLSAIGPVRFVLPSAPVRPVTLNGGYGMRAWYDIYPPSRTGPRREDEAGLRESQAIVHQLIEREAGRGVPAQRTVLMGFSQGCAMTLLAGLRAPQRLAGLVALSGYLPLSTQTGAEISDANRGVPVFMAHGRHDDVVIIERGEAARDALCALGYPVDWRSYPMAHEVCLDEVADIHAFLLRVLAPR